MFVVFDIETTGFSEINSDVIEFAYIMFDNDNNYVKAEQLYFYYDGMSWSEDAYAVHQIPLEFLKTQKDKFKENLIKMFSVLNHANVVGHNALRFDCPFVKTWLMRQGIRNLEYGIIQDTMLAYKPVYKKSRIKLTKLIEYINVDENVINTLLPIWFPGASESHAHEAAYDVVATALLTLRALDKNLMTFEPLVKLNQDVSPDDMSAMFAAGTDLTISDNDYIVRVTESGNSRWHLIQHNVDGSFSNVVDSDGVSDLVAKATADCKVLPIVLDCVKSNTYTGNYGEVAFTLCTDKSRDFELVFNAPYGNFTNKDIAIPMIIANTFSTQYIMDFVAEQED